MWRRMVCFIGVLNVLVLVWVTVCRECRCAFVCGIMCEVVWWCVCVFACLSYTCVCFDCELICVLLSGLC